MKIESRFAHSDGITDIILCNNEQKLITCGSDGDIRIWKDGFDDDPKTFSAMDTCLAIGYHQNKIYVGTENHTVEEYDSNGDKCVIKIKFTAPVNCLDISKNGILIGGSGDKMIQIINLDANPSTSKPLKFRAHEAPVLSIAIDPLEEYFVTSGSDGCVNIWSMEKELTKEPLLVKSWTDLYPKSTDISLSVTLCRMQFSPTNGSTLAIPESKGVSLFLRNTWEKQKTLRCSNIVKEVSVVQYSHCGKILGGGCGDGTIIFWNLSSSQVVLKHSIGQDPICGLAVKYHSSIEVFVTDVKGRFCYIGCDSKPSDSSRISELENSVSNPATPNNDIIQDEAFDDGMDDDLFGAVDLSDDDNDNEISITKIKAEVGFINDEYVGVKKPKESISNEQDDVQSIFSDAGSGRLPKAKHINIRNPITEPQEPFQPNSTPITLQHRFMVWNAVGTIRSYKDEDDDVGGIDIEFHDTGHHQPLHLRNMFDYSMGTLSLDAAVFACARGDDYPSKLFCINYSSWDTSKEWTIDMPNDEDIQIVATADQWIVAITDIYRIRLFSLGGIQHFIYDIPGQVVSAAAFNNLLFVAYNFGVGTMENQSIYYYVFTVKANALRPLVSHQPLPLTPKSKLSWLGFTEEGTPAVADTSDTLRILNGHLWSPYCNMREFLSGPSDHFWVVGVSQLTQNVRAIKCKGAKYPPTLPRPIPMILEAKIPICDLEAEKGRLEDIVLRSIMIGSISKKMSNKGFDVDEYKKKGETDLIKTLINLFELSMKGNRDLRSSEYIFLMPYVKGIEAAVRLATQSRKTALAQRLRAFAQEKLEEDDTDEDDFESNHPIQVNSYAQCRPAFGMNETLTRENYFDVLRGDAISAQVERLRSTTEKTGIGIDNPLLKKQQEEVRKLLNPVEPRPAKANPFKTVSTEPPKSSQDKSFQVIDAWKLSNKPKLTEEFNPKYTGKDTRVKGKKKATVTDKELDETIKKAPKQPTLFEIRKKNHKSVTEINSGTASTPDLSVLQNEDSNSLTSERDFTGDEESQQNYEDDSTSNSSFTGTSKRKRPHSDDAEDTAPVHPRKSMSMFLNTSSL